MIRRHYTPNKKNTSNTGIARSSWAPNVRHIPIPHLTCACLVLRRRDANPLALLALTLAWPVRTQWICWMHLDIVQESGHGERKARMYIPSFAWPLIGSAPARWVCKLWAIFLLGCRSGKYNCTLDDSDRFGEDDHACDKKCSLQQGSTPQLVLGQLVLDHLPLDRHHRHKPWSTPQLVLAHRALGLVFVLHVGSCNQHCLCWWRRQCYGRLGLFSWSCPDCHTKPIRLHGS